MIQLSIGTTKPSGTIYILAHLEVIHFSCSFPQNFYVKVNIRVKTLQGKESPLEDLIRLGILSSPFLRMLQKRHLRMDVPMVKFAQIYFAFTARRHLTFGRNTAVNCWYSNNSKSCLSCLKTN